MIPRTLLVATAAFCGSVIGQSEGDTRSIRFTLPFEKALAEAERDHKLVFLKPIYGGTDQLGERDYRCGSW